MISASEWQNATQKYISNTKLIRELSSTHVESNQTPKEYYDSLKKGFESIRDISVENRKLLDEFFSPVIKSNDSYSDEMVEKIWGFVDATVDGTDMSNLDIMLLIEPIEKLIDDAKSKGNTSHTIKYLFEAFIIYYAVCHIFTRERSTDVVREKYYQKAMNIADELFHFLDKDIYPTLDEKSRETVAISARYCPSIISIKEPNPQRCELFIEYIEKAKKILSDSFYKDLNPNYPWDLNWIRLAEGASCLLENANAIGATKDQCKILCWYADKMDELVNENIPDWIYLSTARTCSARIRFHAGTISWEEYRDLLWNYYINRDNTSYETDDVFDNLSIPVEYLAESAKQELTEFDYHRINQIYQSSIGYLARLRNSECFSLVLEYYGDLLQNFIEYPGGMSFYDMCQYSLASMHLPTYVHSNIVGKLSLCFARHLIKKSPSSFIGSCGCKTEEDVINNEHTIMEYTYKAAIMHDAGKLFMIDTVFIYGRKLLDEEFGLLKCHPTAGATILSKFESTKAYAPIALLHHKRIDNKYDYPSHLILQDNTNHYLASIVACADCLDAATDIVGRSYGTGITLDQYIEEIRNERGTRYNSEVVDLFNDDNVYNDIKFILDHSRKELYYQSYDIMFKHFRDKS